MATALTRAHGGAAFVRGFGGSVGRWAHAGAVAWRGAASGGSKIDAMHAAHGSSAARVGDGMDAFLIGWAGPMSNRCRALNSTDRKRKGMGKKEKDKGEGLICKIA